MTRRTSRKLRRNSRRRTSRGLRRNGYDFKLGRDLARESASKSLIALSHAEDARAHAYAHEAPSSLLTALDAALEKAVAAEKAAARAFILADDASRKPGRRER